jgi:hypothetical protein
MCAEVICYPSIKIEGFKMIDVFNRTGRINPSLQQISQKAKTFFNLVPIVTAKTCIVKFEKLKLSSLFETLFNF